MSLKNSANVIRKSSLVLFIKTVAIIAASVAASGLIVYLLSETPLAPSYGETISSVSLYKIEIIRKSIYIYTVFVLIMLAGIITISLLYSHRVAGPLFRIKVVAKETSEGKRLKSFTIRDNDLLHPLADTLNEMIGKYDTLHEELEKDFEELTNELQEIDASLKDSDRAATEKNINSAKNVSDRIEKTLSGLTL
jgi:methyl-accepting chemotaxis protein